MKDLDLLFRGGMYHSDFAAAPVLMFTVSAAGRMKMSSIAVLKIVFFSN
jgi:hypothetical protein